MTVFWQEWANKVAQNINDHQQKLTRLTTQLDNLERKLGPLFDFWAERQIMILLRNEGKPRTWRWIAHRVGCDAWHPLQILVSKGLVATERSANHILYKLVEADVHGEG